MNDAGLPFARIRDRGWRGDPRVAWFEFSAADGMSEITDEMMSDPETWASCNPGLGDGRISVEAIQRELDALDRRAFCTERLAASNWPDLSLAGGRVITSEQWEACCDPDSVIPSRPCLAVDVRHETRGVGGLAFRSFPVDLRQEPTMTGDDGDGENMVVCPLCGGVGMVDADDLDGNGDTEGRAK